MSARNPYANGYGYSDRYDGGNSNSRGAMNGHGAGGIGDDSGRHGSREERIRERRQGGGWGGFYVDGDESSRERERRPSIDQSDPRGRNRPNWERPSQSSASRSRPQDVQVSSRWRPGRDDTDYLRQLSGTGGHLRTGTNGLRGTQTVEGIVSLPKISTASARI